MACKKHFHIANVLQASKKRGLAGRVIWGKTPMVTHPITALSKRVLAGIFTARSPVRRISAVAKVVGRGVRECVRYDRYLTPMPNDRQAISTEVSCEIAANHFVRLQPYSSHSLHSADQFSDHCSPSITPCLLLHQNILWRYLQHIRFTL